MALTGFALFQPTAAAMAWWANLFGGQNGTRLAHYWCMWVLIVVLHGAPLSGVLAEDLKELPNMLAATGAGIGDRVVPGLPIGRRRHGSDRKYA